MARLPDKDTEALVRVLTKQQTREYVGVSERTWQRLAACTSRTSSVAAGIRKPAQEQTHAAQQAAQSFDHLVGRDE